MLIDPKRHQNFGPKVLILNSTLELASHSSGFFESIFARNFVFRYPVSLVVRRTFCGCKAAKALARRFLLFRL